MTAKLLVAVAFLLLVGLPAQAFKTGWGENPLSGQVEGGVLVIESPATGGVFPLLVIDAPAVGAPGYRVIGRIRYQEVVGEGFLEMWSVFPDGSRYFSRTLAGSGEMALLTGTSDWRQTSLPFLLEENQHPQLLEINLVLPGSGTVWLESLELDSAENDWWSQTTSDLVGGWGGGAVGLLGALVGLLGGRRKARRFVLSATLIAAIAGMLLLVVAAVALAGEQPRHVTFPLLVGGVILGGVFGVNHVTLRRAYAQAEMRKMAALDA